MTVFLIGMPGVGKSFWLKKLKRNYDCVATDLDLQIEIQEQERISNIFKIKGEEYFRQKESSMLKHMVDVHKEMPLHIISTGGGTPCFFDNMEFMLSNGWVIYLQASAEFIKSRLEQSKNSRPMIENLPLEERLPFLKQLLSQREKFYNQSHVIFDALSLRMTNFAEFFEQYKILPSCTNKQ